MLQTIPARAARVARLARRALRRVRAASRSATWVSVLAAWTAWPAIGSGGDLLVQVTGLDRQGIAETVVSVAPLGGAPAPMPPKAPRPTAIMDQKNRAFVPRVLVVAVGTSVEFPNSDLVSHQVYSFSEPKRFQLPLYRGTRHPPVVFDREGLVVLGCNIHDEMAGYIYVTSAPQFGITDAGGRLELHGLAPGDYRVTLWSPLITDEAATLVREVHVGDPGRSVLEVGLHRSLRARPEPRPERARWEY